MDDGDHEGSPSSIHLDSRFIVATTLATLVVAGSTYIWRSNPRRLLGQWAQESSTGTELFVPEPASKNVLVADDDLSSHVDGKDPKSSRSKERRRRGKDPLRELLKGGKKSKVLTKSTKITELDDNQAGPTDTLPSIQEPNRSRQSRERSLTASSRSVSTTSTSNSRTPLPSSDWAGPSPTTEQSTHECNGSDLRNFGSLNVHKSNLPAKSLTGPESHPSDHSLQPSTLTHKQSADFPNSYLSTSSSTSHSSSRYSFELDSTPDTSPTLSLSGKTPTLEQPESSPASPCIPTDSIAPSTSMPPAKKDSAWDWDSVPSSSTSESTLRKPPRFRSKSRGSGLSSLSPTKPTFSMTAASFESSLGSNGLSDDSHPVAFPTLNSPSGPPSNQSSRATSQVTSNTNGTGSSGLGNGHPNGTTPKRAPTPRRPPTPSGTNTPPPSLSAQTQLASLRGALEAARLREEKSKVELEKYSKDLEMMRWENATWRRREVELQNQIHQLMHQVQTYVSMFTSMPAQSPSVTQHHRSNNNTNGTDSLQNGYHFASPGPHSPPPHLQIPPIFMANSLLSPMSLNHSPHTPFYPYSPLSPQLHAHPHVQMQANQSPHQQPHLMSMLFPQSASASESGPPSVAGSSSVGSNSPDITCSPTPSRMPLDRGRRRTRTRTQTADGRIGERGSTQDGGGEGVDRDEDPSDMFSEMVDGDDSDDYDDEGSVSEVLADAILKRPGTIKGLSKKGKNKDSEPFVEHTEFTFPSLSDLGNVNPANSRPVETPLSDEDSDVDKGSAETMIEAASLAGVEAVELHKDTQ